MKSFRWPTIFSSLKSVGNVSVHSVSSCRILGPNLRTRACRRGETHGHTDPQQRQQFVSLVRVSMLRCAYRVERALVQLLLLDAEFAHPGQQLRRRDEQTSAQQEGEHVGFLFGEQRETSNKTTIRHFVIKRKQTFGRGSNWQQWRWHFEKPKWSLVSDRGAMKSKSPSISSSISCLCFSALRVPVVPQLMPTV